MIFCENESPPSCDMGKQVLNKKNMRKIHDSCDEAIDRLDKKRCVSYHNLKKIIHQIRPTSDKVIEALNKKRKVVSHKWVKVKFIPIATNSSCPWARNID
jgi:hypothetical protein